MTVDRELLRLGTMAVVGIALTVGLLMWLDRSLDERQERRYAWLEQRGCLRVGYLPNGRTGVYQCKDGAVYTLRDVPAK